MKTITIIFLFFTITINAQSIEKFSIDSGGASTSAGGIEVLYTIGEVNVQELSVGNIQISEGFINPEKCSGATTTWDGISWDKGTPDNKKEAIIAGVYITSVHGNIDACEVNVGLGITLTITAGNYVNVENNIIVEGTLLVEHEGSIVQVSDVAKVTNLGSITVSKTTPSLTPQDFMIMGSPMTAETRTGVYNNARRVLNHITGNFIPNPDVEMIDSGTANWADDNGDNWAIYTGGAINPGEGYLVKPQSDAFPSGSYDLDYTLGTLNSGVIPFSVLYNGTQNSSPNMMGNPYASAIDADLFAGIAGPNTMINEVYFWEHLTAPSSAYPGYQANNFDMGDISVYVPGVGGSAADNGGDIPEQWIASGQGFGIKATAMGTAIFNNAMRVTGPNDNYRNNEGINRFWLDVKNETYELGSNMLVAFTENASDDFDRFDSKRFATPVSMYSIVETEEELKVQGRTVFNEEQEISLGFRTMVEELQTYTILLRDIQGEELSNATVYLEDRLLNTAVNLSEENYIFTSNDGVFNDRFAIVFQEPSVLGVLDNSLERIAIYPNPTDGILRINSGGIMIQNLEFIDVQGRVVYSEEQNSSNSFSIDISSMQSALYFVKLYTSEGVALRRILKK